MIEEGAEGNGTSGGDAVLLGVPRMVEMKEEELVARRRD